MCGNVWEWCQDDYADHAYSALSKGDADPIFSSDSETKVIRGGSFDSFPSHGRCSFRSKAGADQRRPDIGFRIVISARGE